MSGPRTLGLVPARAGSKGIPGKNLRPLAGRPLLAWTADAALAAGVLDRIVLSTDSEEIAAAGRSLSLEVPFLRPSALADDDSPMLAVVQHALRALAEDGDEPELVVLLQPTAPLRRPEHVRRAVELLRTTDATSVVGVVEIPAHYRPEFALRLRGEHLEFVLPAGRAATRRQDLPVSYSRDGTVYGLRAEHVLSGDLYGPRIRPLVVPREESVNLDDEADWELAERRLRP